MSNNNNKNNSNNNNERPAESRRRLLRDLKELHQHPLENVAAAPVDDSNMFIWHANMRGTDPTMKEVFHLILEFPSTYPRQPPSITLCTPLPHPNVFPHKKGKEGYSLCMDMLEEGQWGTAIDMNVKYSGWSSAYSVQLILVQLQSFLLDAQLQYATHKSSLASALAAAKSFTCRSCSHKPSAPFPPFATPQQMEAKTCVRVVKFVPPVRPPHMTTIAVLNRVIRASVQSHASSSSPSSTPTPSKPPAPYIPPPPPVWQVVASSRRDVLQTTQTTTSKKKKSHKKKPETNAPVTQGPHVVQKVREEVLDGPQVFVRAKKNRKSKNKTTPAPAQVELKKPKDYVQIMLKEAETREKMLKERAAREQEERKREQQERKKEQARLKKQANKPAANNNNRNNETNTNKDNKINTNKSNGNINNATETAQTNNGEFKSIPSGNRTPKSNPPASSSSSSSSSNKAKASTNTADAFPSLPSFPSSHKSTPTLSYQQVQKSTRPDITKLGSLAIIPPDSLLSILSYLSVPEVGLLAQISSDMRKLSEDGLLWRALFSRHYPKSKLTASNVAEWKFVFYREVDHILDDLVCFHTKLSFEEDVLGVPIRFTINPSTEKVDYISSTLDYISSTAFNKYNIRRSAFKEDFTDFLPLYITEQHFQRGLPEIKKLIVKLSPEYRSNGFHPSMALSVFGKLMNTMVVLVMDGGVSVSERALNGYIAFHRLLMAFVEMYPQLMVEVNLSIEEFIRSETGRMKSTIPSMGDWLALLSVSNKYSWKSVAKLVITETFDRNVLWICKESPSLATLADISKSSTPGVEHKRLKESFEYSQVSGKLLLFHSYFLSFIARPPGMSVGQVADNYDRYFGRPNSKTLDSFRSAVKKITGIKGWPDFFGLAGLPCPSPAGMTQMLRESVRNSKRKGYHSDNTNFRNVQASGTSVLLRRGDNFSAPRNLERVKMGLGWGYVEDKWYLLDATCFEYTKDGELVESIDWQHRWNANGSVIHSGDVIDWEKSTVTQTIDLVLSKIREHVQYLVFSITAYTGKLKDAKLPWVRMNDADSASELCQYVLDKTGEHTAVVMCVMQRNPIKKCWDLKVLGKLDEGGYPQGYIPMKQNMGLQLKSGKI